MDNVLEHIQHPEKIIGEVRRILKGDGRFIVGAPGIKGFESEEDHKVFYTENDLLELILPYGFEVIKVFYTPFRSGINILDSIVCMPF